MLDRVLKPEIENVKTPSTSSDDVIQGLERDDGYLPVPTEVSPVSVESRVVVYNDPRSPGADRFRLAQLFLKSLQAARKLKSVLITSPLPEAGKSTVALNLATVLSEQGKLPVLLLEADVYRPAISKKLGLEPWPGLTDCYRSGSDPMLAIRRIEPLEFYLLPAGQSSEDGSRLVQSNYVRQLIEGLSSSFFSWIVIDAPPTTPIADILALQAAAEATLLVARAGKTPREAIEESVRNLGRDHIIGIILNNVEGLDRVYSKYYGYGKREDRVKLAKPKTVAGLGLNHHAK